MQQRANPPGRSALVMLEDVGVIVKGNAHVAVPETFRHYMHGLSVRQQERCTRVAEAVKGNPPNVSRLTQQGERAIAQTPKTRPAPATW